MYWLRVSERGGRCARVCCLNRRNVLIACFGMCLSECIGRVFRNVLVAVLGFVCLIVGMYWSRVSECVGSCARICRLNRRNVLVSCFGMCW